MGFFLDFKQQKTVNLFDLLPDKVLLYISYLLVLTLSTGFFIKLYVKIRLGNIILSSMPLSLKFGHIFNKNHQQADDQNSIK